MRSWKGSGRPLASIAVFYALVFLGRALWNRYELAVSLEPGKRDYLHYEFVDLRLRTRDADLLERWKAAPPQELVLAGDDDVAGRLRAKPFFIARRKPAALPPGLTVLTLESADPWRDMKVLAPDGRMKDWRGMLDWAQYIHADAFWVLGGQTPGRRPGEVWVPDNLDLIPEMAREAHARGLKFGVYAECYLTMSKRRLPRYRYAVDIQDGRPAPTRAVSLADERRVDDIVALLKRFRDIPQVDYLGLDYIRNALGGYELAERFYAEMPGVFPPPNWSRLSADDKVLYFARKKVMRRDAAFIDSWQWWRAHEVGLIVRRIKAELGGSKPLWAFTLTWDKGHQHGQDPVMMNDAGVDADALMLYEADRAQFAGIMRDFHAYLKRGDVQLIVGDIVDWKLHQNSPDGPLELYRRAAEAIDGIYADGPARGVFFHDVKRALTGRLGPWGSRGWMDQARRAGEHLKRVSAPPTGNS